MKGFIRVKTSGEYVRMVKGSVGGITYVVQYTTDINQASLFPFCINLMPITSLTKNELDECIRLLAEEIRTVKLLRFNDE